jgi:hypothetical protein
MKCALARCDYKSGCVSFLASPRNHPSLLCAWISEKGCGLLVIISCLMSLLLLPSVFPLAVSL